MIDLPANDRPLERFALRESERRVRRSPGAAMATSGTIGLSRPLLVPLTAALAAEDVELAAFWAAERDARRYDYLTFRCSLDPDADHPFEKVWVEISLADEGGEGAIAWSMSPKAISDVTQITSGAKLGSAAKLLTAELSEQRSVERRSLFLQARGELSARPYWLFEKTEAAPVSGMFALHLVLRSPKGVRSRGTISARAEISTRTFFLFASTAQVAGPGLIDFDGTAET